MSEIGLIVHQGRSEAAAAARGLVQWLSDAGHSVRMPAEEASAAGRGDLRVDPGGFADGLDVVVTLGGDGSILRAVELIGEAGVPILGVDFGRMGYLTEVRPQDARDAINSTLAGAHSIEERMLLVVEFGPSGADAAPDHGAVPGRDAASAQDAAPAHDAASGQDAGPGRGLSRSVALNEAVVERRAASNALRTGVSINDEPFTTYAADGLIVATPTGSTAYALSARGPVIDPEHRALLLTPVSPHMLFDRSLVVSADTRLRLQVLDHRGATLSVDGRRLAELRENDVVVCAASPHAARLVTFGARRFHQVLKAKFGLNDR